MPRPHGELKLKTCFMNFLGVRGNRLGLLQLRPSARCGHCVSLGATARTARPRTHTHTVCTHPAPTVSSRSGHALRPHGSEQGSVHALSHTRTQSGGGWTGHRRTRSDSQPGRWSAGQVPASDERPPRLTPRSPSGPCVPTASDAWLRVAERHTPRPHAPPRDRVCRNVHTLAGDTSGQPTAARLTMREAAPPPRTARPTVTGGGESHAPTPRPGDGRLLCTKDITSSFRAVTETGPQRLAGSRSV